MKTCPSILEPYAKNYILQIKRLSPYFQYFQIDIADDLLVDNKTASLEDLITQLKAEGTENFQDISFDFHLMVKDYESEIKKLEEIKDLIQIKNVFVHRAVVNNFAFDVMNFFSFPVGIALDPKDSVEDLKTNFTLEMIPVIQIMTVVPGAQGKPFEPDALNKVGQLRALDYRNKIYLDGAVNDKTLPAINALESKPDYVCPGSFLTKCPDDKLKERADYLLKFE